MEDTQPLGRVALWTTIACATLTLVFAAGCSSGSSGSAPAETAGDKAIGKLRTKLIGAGFTCSRSSDGNVRRSRTVLCRLDDSGTTSLVLSWYADHADPSTVMPRPASPMTQCVVGYVLSGSHWISLTNDESVQSRAHAAIGGKAKSPDC